MSTNDRPYTIAFSEEEFVALSQFMSYGATRGNHREDGQPGPGPLTPYVDTMVTLNTRMREARSIVADDQIVNPLEWK